MGLKHSPLRPLVYFISSAMRTERHMATRQALKTLGERSELYRFDMIEETAAAVPSDPTRMHQMIDASDAVILLVQPADNSGIGIREGVQIEIDHMIARKKPALVFVSQDFKTRNKANREILSKIRKEIGATSVNYDPRKLDVLVDLVEKAVAEDVIVRVRRSYEGQSASALDQQSSTSLRLIKGGN